MMCFSGMRYKSVICSKFLLNYLITAPVLNILSKVLTERLLEKLATRTQGDLFNLLISDIFRCNKITVSLSTCAIKGAQGQICVNKMRRIYMYSGATELHQNEIKLDYLAVGAFIFCFVFCLCPQAMLSHVGIKLKSCENKFKKNLGTCLFCVRTSTLN